ncbi:hypothetical protein KFE25_012599 [Diacronema lutheri]|uniref:Methyltransferase domain-containing protein n=2 Tax=Diacronema lutheri TaxID=2081491 RepID=A0A8J5XAY6_DIALT|nr:hypothetical protein KFE25_012599 [Diacronema lutheri]
MRASLLALSLLSGGSAGASALRVRAARVARSSLCATQARAASSEPSAPPPQEWGPLLAHPGMFAPGAARRKLTRHHASDFADADTLFDRVARAVCESGALPRKELFEAWAVALRVHAHFPRARRFADVASGHGLLAWMLLLLDSESHLGHTRTAVCIDRRMPASAERLEAQMLRAFPHLRGRWHFVEADAAHLEADASCVLAAVHACGGLSDALVSLALAARAPIALVPCCHTFKTWAPHPLVAGCAPYAPFAAHGVHGAERRALVEAALSGGSGSRAVAHFLDGARVAALQAGGYAVVRENLPVQLTAQHTLLLAVPAHGEQSARAAQPIARARAAAPTAHTAASPRLLPRARPAPRVPLADSSTAIAACAALSGRVQADARKAVPPPTLDLSAWLPPDNGSAPPLTADALARLAERVCHAQGGAGVRVRVQPLDLFRRSDGRCAQTFRVEYDVPRPARGGAAPARADESAPCGARAARDATFDDLAAERERALAWHMSLQEAHIAQAFPGAEVRGSELLARQRAQRAERENRTASAPALP